MCVMDWSGILGYSANLNPKLYCRPKNVSIGKWFYYVPDNAIATDAIPKGEKVKIIEKLAVRERGKALVKVQNSKGLVQNVLLEHLAVIF